jgi:hypothetical protein
MAIFQRYRTTFEDYIRQIIGDKDGCLFDSDELASYVDRWSDRYLTTTTIRAENSKYYLNCCGRGKAVRELQVTSGVDATAYIIDEQAGVVIYDPDDPETTSPAPSDGDTIEVSYYCVCTNHLLSELFMTLGSNHAKLVAAQNIMGVQMDLKDLSDAFYAQAVRWSAES